MAHAAVGGWRGPRNPPQQGLVGGARSTQDERRELAREVFDEIRIRDGKLVAVKPRPEYVPLFAYSIWKENQYVPRLL